MSLIKNVISVNLFVICAFVIGPNLLTAQTAETEFQRALDYYYQDDYNTVFRITDPLVRTHFPQNKAYYWDKPGTVYRVYKLIIVSLYEIGRDDQIDAWIDHIVGYFSGKFGATEVITRLEQTQI